MSCAAPIVDFTNFDDFDMSMSGLGVAMVASLAFREGVTAGVSELAAGDGTSGSSESEISAMLKVSSLAVVTGSLAAPWLPDRLPGPWPWP